jgi:hypothetical protein
MKTPILVKDNIDMDISLEVMRFFARVGAVLGALIGIWALTNLAAALASVGPLAMVRGYITAITGL